MMCQKCGIRTATIHFTNIINGNKTELHLCEACANEQEGMSQQIAINDLMSGFFGIKPQTDRKLLKCDFCGSTQNDISKRGKAGCEHCYQVFNSYLTPIVRKIHGTDVHTGKVPANKPDKEIPFKNAQKEDKGTEGRTEELEDMMKKAIAEENYEEAARLRDCIKNLKISGEKGGEEK